METVICKADVVEVSGAPEIITVLPLGHVVSQKGEFEVDAESYAAMKAQIAKRGVDLVVDYEHQTLSGDRAPAAGWVKELILREDGIAARVEWTPAAKKYLANREYRYLSPVITVRKPDNKATGLHSIALTNTPAVEGMAPIVNKFDPNKGGQDNMDIIRELAALLGLDGDATGEQVLEAVKNCVSERESLKAGASGQAESGMVANKAVCELLDLKAGAPVSDVSAKIMELKSGIVGGVNLVQEMQALKQKLAERDAGDAVQLALKAGKIAAAQREWAEEYALKDPTGFAAFVEKAPAVVPMGELMAGQSAQKSG